MIPLVLCGGSGTRLWPVSRAAFPKQFNRLLDESLLAKTLRRLAPLGAPRVVAVAGSEALVAAAVAESTVTAGEALYEPCGRNTAPAVALACLRLIGEGRGEELAAVFPADHLIERPDELRRAVGLAAECARRGQVVTLGIRPTHAATGYGYIEAGEVFLTAGGPGAGGDGSGGERRELVAHRTLGFREKPDAASAEQLVESGNFLWNAGMFVFRVSTLAGHFARLMPATWRALEAAGDDPAALAGAYRNLAAESLDYGVMEHLDEQVTIPCDIGWNDLGSWDEVAGVRASGEGVFEVDAGDNFVFPHGGRVYGLVGVEGLVVVDTADALLVARKGTTQRVKELVAELRAAGRREATEHTFEVRPWGSFEVLRDSDRFKSKILRVAPHQRLSYQSHRHRAEHWVVVAGHPRVVLDGKVLEPAPGEAVYVPVGARHRIENPTDEPVEIVEVQLGSYFGEDDIVRYEDDYERV